MSPFLIPLFFLPSSLSLCRNPTCRIVTAKWLAYYRTRWAGTVAPRCSYVALPLATTMQRPNPPWCLASGNYASILSCHGLLRSAAQHTTTHTFLAQLQLLGCFSAEMCSTQICYSHITTSNFAFEVPHTALEVEFVLQFSFWSCWGCL